MSRPVSLLVQMGFVLLRVACATSWASAQEQQPSLAWMQGPATAPIGSDLAEIALGESYVFLDQENTKLLMELTQNPLTGTEVATVAPVADDEGWFLIFEWEEVGYVPDDEKDDLDTDAMLESIVEGSEHANKERAERGWGTFTITGWHEAPHYDERTQNLSWAIVGESGNGTQTINRMVKVLGRRGVMTTTLVAGPDELARAIPEVDALLEGYRFQPGNTYAEYVPDTDKLAEYGLTALVVGGAGAALLKSGLLAKIWKPLVAALAALGVGLKRVLFGGRSSDHDMEKPIT